MRLRCFALAFFLVLNFSQFCFGAEVHFSPKGEWGPLVQLRAAPETYANYPTPFLRELPDPSGWWIAPIHANLLTSGDVLITGWARVKEKECGVHCGRQWPATFVVSVGPLDTVPQGARDGTLSITPIAENPDLLGGVNPRDPVDVLYCSGHAPLPDGRIFFTGGARYVNLEMGGYDHHKSASEVSQFEDEYGLSYARIFDPKTRTITRVKNEFPDGPEFAEVEKIAKAHPSSREENPRDWTRIYEQGMMWYPTNLRLPDGKILVAAGFARQSGPFDPQFVNRSLSVFDPESGQWEIWVKHKDLTASRAAPDSSEVLNLAGFDYVHLFLLPRPVLSEEGYTYQVAVYGGSNATYGFVSLDRSTPVEKRLYVPRAGVAQGEGPKRPPGFDGSEVGGSDTTGLILPSGEIVLVGGGWKGNEGGQRIDVYNPYTNRWRAPLYTGVSRIRAASTLLPDGRVLILNGEESYSEGTNLGDRRKPILFDPAAGAFEFARGWDFDGDRGYHNFSVLLKDGRVLVGGGRELIRNADGVEVHRIGCERPDLQVFTPPYLVDGRARPVVMGAPAEPLRLKIGQDGAPVLFNLTGPALARDGGVVLMALGAETHHFDQNQRMVRLRYEIVKGGVRIYPPESALEAPIGMYNLFLVSAEGVPSLGMSVKVE